MLVVWVVCNILLAVILARAVENRMLSRYRVFYGYLAFVLLASTA